MESRIDLFAPRESVLHQTDVILNNVNVSLLAILLLSFATQLMDFDLELLLFLQDTNFEGKFPRKSIPVHIRT